MKVLVTGSEGYVGAFVSAELLSRGYSVVGLDNFSKYGPGVPAFGTHPGYRFVFGDAGDRKLLKSLLSECEYFIINAALTGGVPFLSQRPYDILAENERITKAAFDAAIAVQSENPLKRVVLISSSAVYENAQVIPTPESQAETCPAPGTSYGLQKLCAEFYAKSAFMQYGLDYTIVRPFNVAGVVASMRPDDAEERYARSASRSTHVIPQLAQKILGGRNPLHILGDGSQVRSFIHGRDLALGIRLAMERLEASGHAFNLSSDQAVSIMELAGMLWQRLAPGRTMQIESGPTLAAEVRLRAADMAKARELLGFRAETGIDGILDEVALWASGQGD
ncbi:MAG: NAD(P)-dependent oxidoreductase [Deltaproteobacteria bacterium]|nr:NAD(P)-dependent oxidoreductase [Deltaproteobacteria bacterium]